MGKLSNLEFFRKVAETGEAPAEGSRFIYPPTIAKTLGFRLIEIGPGTATMELMADTEIHANPMGTIHGGVLCDIADAAICTAHATSLKEDESFTSIDLQINFFRPVWQATVRAEARVINRSANVGYVECDITDQNGKRIAKAASTCMVLRGDKARARGLT